MRAEPRRELDAPGELVQRKSVEPVTLVTARVVVLGLEVVGRRIGIRERITLVVVIRKVLGQLIVELELELFRHLLVHAYGPAAEQRLGRALNDCQIAGAVGASRAEAGRPRGSKDRIVAINEPGEMNSLGVVEGRKELQRRRQSLLEVG